MDKSHVSVEQARCPICGKDEDTGALLLHRRLAQTLDRFTVIGWGLCKEHQKLFDDGYIALIELNGVPENTKMVKLEESLPLRTGNLAHIRRTVFEDAFGTKPPTNAFVFVEIGIIEKLQQTQEATE